MTAHRKVTLLKYLIISRVKMNAAFLSPSELDYELQIRDLRIDGIEAKRIALRNILREESTGKSVSPKTILMDSSEEYKTVRDKFEELTRIPKSQRRQEGKLFHTKLLHLISRLERLLTLKITEDIQGQCNLMLLDLRSLLKEFEYQPQKEKTYRENESFLKTIVPETRNSSRMTKLSSEQVEEFQNAVQLVLSVSKQLQSTLINSDEEEEVEELEAEPERYAGEENLSNNNPKLSFSTKQYKSIPVHKWGIRFSGDGKGLKLTEFLAQLKVLAQTEGLSNANLHRYAYYLFSSNALRWYQAFYTKFKTWDELVKALRQEFLPSDHDFWVFREINNRFQKRDESFGLFLADMELLFQDLLEPVSEETKLKTVMRNMRPFYMERLSLVDVNSISELASFCKRLDNVKYSIENRYGEKAKGRVYNISELYPEDDDDTTSHEVETLNIRKYKPKQVSKAIICFNCKKSGHHFNECQEDRKTFCFRCGKEDVILPNCSKCTPNSKN